MCAGVRRDIQLLELVFGRLGVAQDQLTNVVAIQASRHGARGSFAAIRRLRPTDFH